MLRILHISDTHLTKPGGTHHGRDTAAALRDMLTRIGRSFDVVIHTGDVSEDGSTESYETARQILGDFAERHGVPCLYAVGNHDEQSAFAQVLGSGVKNSSGKVFYAAEVGDWRVIVLDTHRAGLIGGELDEEQFAWLRRQLHTSAKAGTVIAMHHPCVEPGTDAQAGIALAEPQRFIAALAGSDVRAILFGHVHHQLFDSVKVDDRWVPVLAAPAVTYLVDTFASRHTEVTKVASGAQFVEVARDGRVRFIVATEGTADVRIKQLNVEQTREFSQQLKDHDAQARATTISDNPGFN